jgi:hypothetical protein
VNTQEAGGEGEGGHRSCASFKNIADAEQLDALLGVAGMCVLCVVCVMCVCVYPCLCVCVFALAHLGLCVCVHAHLCVYEWMYTHAHTPLTTFKKTVSPTTYACTRARNPPAPTHRHTVTSRPTLAFLCQKITVHGLEGVMQ